MKAIFVVIAAAVSTFVSPTAIPAEISTALVERQTSLVGTWEGSLKDSKSTGEYSLTIEAVDATSGVVTGAHRLQMPSEISREYRIVRGLLTGNKLTYIDSANQTYELTLIGGAR
jgi:hypothetical protein